ncbi:nli interacting factor-like phosphatase family protein [Stylonychia lemnae]|uniref:Mitochondrial import inner membrane translocase subunit TIM50 n=1 Tax=Stylonychia lemnae TaxID=5949 RepID=A0A077ZQ98_STYLE|nr:nli interacting factor-like phosphatase family protein [Stylonychia lemnae]|eukprot:CDW72087.1 nli interacting factor-like phosphatase family protein [Stylonychia lemnae]
MSLLDKLDALQISILKEELEEGRLPSIEQSLLQDPDEQKYPVATDQIVETHIVIKQRKTQLGSNDETSKASKQRENGILDSSQDRSLQGPTLQRIDKDKSVLVKLPLKQQKRTQKIRKDEKEANKTPKNTFSHYEFTKNNPYSTQNNISDNQSPQKLQRAQSNDFGIKINHNKKRKKGKDRNRISGGGEKIKIDKCKLKRVKSNFNESNDKLLNFGIERNGSSFSLDSNNSAFKKSCLPNEQRKTFRRSSLSGTKVRFNQEVGPYKEQDEEAKIDENRRKYKKGSNNAHSDILIHLQVQLRPKKMAYIKKTDPVGYMPYHRLFLSDKNQQKIYLTSIHNCRSIQQTLKEGLKESKLNILKQKLTKVAKTTQYNQNMNIQQLKNEIKQQSKKTIVFNLEQTILQVILRDVELSGYDASAYVNLFGKNSFKLYLSYRPYLKEMLGELKDDFELILMGTKDQQYVEKIAATLQKDEQYFDFLINKEMLYTHPDLGHHTLDLNILLGSRDLKDIIVVSHSCERHLFQYGNGVPVRDYSGCKKDLSFFALTKYLKSFKDVIDVRTKIAEDFGL